MSVEPYAIVFTNGDNDTFPLWYLQEVEGLRQDVTVIVWSYLATPWYAEQLRDLTQPCGDDDPKRDRTTIICQRPFEPDKAIPLYRDRDWPVPTRSILEMTDAEVERIPECYPIDRRTGQCGVFPDTVPVPFGEIVGFVARGAYLWRNDILVARIMQTAAGDRPIYFASTTGTFERFNIQPYMIRQGVAFKLATSQMQPTESIVPLPPQARFQGGRVFPVWVDVDRTRALLDEHFVYRDLAERLFWPDHSTSGIPLQYYQAYTALATIYLITDQRELSDDAVERALRFLAVALGPEYLPAPAAPAAEAPTIPSPDTPQEN
ncbi:MAG: hypothetical protein AMS25_01675 [Gemmatimonas sp. SM23_52]|nr:MAG: hypothetical protein AMS25_01675 [Gemmatimonas sp. SM23_52]